MPRLFLRLAHPTGPGPHWPTLIAAEEPLNRGLLIAKEPLGREI